MRRIRHRALLVVSLVLLVTSIFLPWLSEHGTSPLAIMPRIEYYNKFWSYQAEINVFFGTGLVHSFILSFQEYWFSEEFFGFPNVYRAWMLVFLFQILAAATGAISIFKEKVKGHLFPLICTLASSAIAVSLGYYQLLQHSASGRGFSSHTVGFDIGFYLALGSVVFCLISLFIQIHSS